MSYTNDDADRWLPDSNATAARIGELLRLQLWLEQPDLDLDAVRGYVADRLARLYPVDYHVYRRRWHDAAEAPGPLLSFLEWWPLVQELEGRAVVAEMTGEEDVGVKELQRVLRCPAPLISRERPCNRSPDLFSSHPVPALLRIPVCLLDAASKEPATPQTPST